MENQNTELYLLRLFFNQSLFNKYSKYIQSKFVKDNSKELFQLFETVSLFHTKFPGKDIPSIFEFEVFFYACYPAINAKEKDIFAPLFKKMSEITPDETLAESIVQQHVERVRATEFAVAALEVASGKRAFNELYGIVEEGPKSGLEALQDDFVTDDLEVLLNTTVSLPGLRWRLTSMNQHLGSLRKGDFGFIFKRPETGGTTFLASEVTHMATQTDKPIYWFNNEEQGAKVKLRCFQAAFGVTLDHLRQNWQEYRDRWLDLYGNRFHIVDRAAISSRDMESILRNGDSEPALIVVDQIDKVKGFTDDRKDLELKAVYQWHRELSKTFGAVIGVCQAGATAEGKKYLEMDDVDNSKTGKQGEADWILGIGKSHLPGYESLRHFHLCKNKLIGDSDTIPERRHWSWDVVIEAERARYRDVK